MTVARTLLGHFVRSLELVKLEHEELLLARGAGWKPALAALGVAVVAILVLYRETAISIVSLWGVRRPLRTVT